MSNSKVISAAQLEASVDAAAAAYHDEDQQLRDRQQHVTNVLNTIAHELIKVMDMFTKRRVPATASPATASHVEHVDAASLTIGAAPLPTGKLEITKTKDAYLIVTQERTRPGSELERVVGPRRPPSDFGTQHFKAEIETFLKWVFDAKQSFVVGMPPKVFVHDDEDDLEPVLR